MNHRLQSIALLFGLFLSLTPAFAADPPAQPLDPVLRTRVVKTLRIFYRVPPSYDVKVRSLGASEFPGWQKLEVEFSTSDRKQTNDFLLSNDGKKLLRYVPLDVEEHPGPKIDIANRPIRGDKNAPVTVVVFDDFQCPFCSLMHAQLFPDVLKEYAGKVRFIYKDFPLAEKHLWATRAAVDANCLAAQSNDAYWEFADMVHARQDEITGPKGTKTEVATGKLDKMAQEVADKYFLNEEQLSACMKANDVKTVQDSVKQGDDLDVEATPTLFIEGEKLEGAVPVDHLEAILDRTLRDAGIEPPVHPVKKDQAAEAVTAKPETAPAASKAATAPANAPAPAAVPPNTKK